MSNPPCENRAMNDKLSSVAGAAWLQNEPGGGNSALNPSIQRELYP